MGEAKRRRTADPTWGQPVHYLVTVLDADTNEVVMEIPFPTWRRASLKETNAAALSIVIIICHFLSDPFKQSHREGLSKALGFGSLQLLQKEWLHPEIMRHRYIASITGDLISQEYGDEPIEFTNVKDPQNETLIDMKQLLRLARSTN